MLSHLMAWAVINSLKVDIVNYSSSGFSSNAAEAQLLHLLYNKGIKVVVAAGNESRDLDENCNVFPACYYPYVIPVGNIGNGSNHGKIVTVVRNGNHQCYNDHCFSGTSQATALYSSELAIELSKYEK
jgi:hypothetical protein